MTETDIREQLRARVMVVNATQDIDAPLISLPADFASMGAIRDAMTGKSLTLEDNWTGPLYGDGTQPVTSYRLVGIASNSYRTPSSPIRRKSAGHPARCE